LRMYSRLTIKRRLAADDFLIILGLVRRISTCFGDAKDVQDQG
jgi:hypothetical protein